MKLKNLEECIWDAELTREKISHNIDTIVEREKDPIKVIRRVGQTQDDLNRAQNYLAIEKQRFETAINQRDRLKQSLEARQVEVKKATENRKNTEKHLVDARVKLAGDKEMLNTTREGIAGQQRRIITELQNIYPIEPVSVFLFFENSNQLLIAVLDA